MIKGKKCGIPYIIGSGILTKNPEEVTELDFKCYRRIFYINFEDYWYKVKGGFQDIDSVHTYITKDVYSKEQFIGKVLSII